MHRIKQDNMFVLMHPLLLVFGGSCSFGSPCVSQDMTGLGESPMGEHLPVLLLKEHKPNLLVDEMAQIWTILCFDYGLCAAKNHVLEPPMKTAERKNAAGVYEISPPFNKCYS